jgi:hypothetical protein
MANENFFANPALGKHMGGDYPGKGSSTMEPHETSGNDGKMPPHIFHHSHSGGVTTHIFHHDGRHEMHEHSHGDADGMAAHVHEHHGGGMEDHEQDENSGSMNG